MEDVDELDLEAQGRVGRNDTGDAALAVRRRARAGEHGLATHRQLLHALCPAGDDLVQRKDRGLAALVGAVELLSVGQGASVVDANDAGGRRALAVGLAGANGFNYDAGGQRLGSSVGNTCQGQRSQEQTNGASANNHGDRAIADEWLACSAAAYSCQ